jgi:REP element-mobilizing transposase RayT
MARPLRIDLPGLTYHVWAHATSGSTLFRDAIDKDSVLRFLRDEVRLSKWTCLAYAIMSTHYHLLLRQEDASLSRGFCRLNLRYARYYNARYGLRGHVFDRRFQTRVVEGPGDELETARYIALNPWRAHMCSLPEDYGWSSYGATIGLYPPDPIIDLEAALAPVAGSRAAYRRFVEEADPRVRRGQVRARPRRVTRRLRAAT